MSWNKHEWIHNLLDTASKHKIHEKHAALIKAIIDSDLNDDSKFSFYMLLSDHDIRGLTITSLREQLSASYQNVDIETYLDKLFFFNPKLGEVDMQSGLSGRDENNQGRTISQKVFYDKDVDKYFSNADETINHMKKVIRAILIDAKKWVT